MRFSTLSELGRGVLITGGAGAGKTHALSSIIEQLAPALKMSPFQVVPVLSAMHGARRRLLQRLTALQRSCRSRGVDLFLEVSTIDAFALSLVIKLQERTPSDLPNFEVGDFAPVHRAAVAAMSRDSIKQMCAHTFPLVVIDELQDCRGTRLEFVMALAECVPVIAAADEFQVLDAEGSCPALDQCKARLRTLSLGEKSARTNDGAVIATAKALRTGSPTSAGVSCYFAPSGDVAAATIMTLSRKWRGSTAILAFKCEGSHFVEQVFTALTKARRSDEKMRPISVAWDPSERSERAAVLSPLTALPEELSAAVRAEEHGLSEAHRECWNRCVRRARRRGQRSVQKQELLEELRRAVHFNRAFAVKGMRRVLTTIHSAKNQEWHNVVVLWSGTHFKAATPVELKRRLLYNAVTRARTNCVIIADGAAHKWVDDQVLGLLGQPTQESVDASRPKNAGSRRRRHSAKKVS